MKKIKWEYNKFNKTHTAEIGDIMLFCYFRNTGWESGMWINADGFFHDRQGDIHPSLGECKQDTISLVRNFLVDSAVSINGLMKQFGLNCEIMETD